MRARVLARHLQQRGVHDHLPDGEGPPERVFLLDVPGVPSDLGVRGLVPVEEDEALHDAHGLPLADDVHQSTLSGSTGAHQGDHVARVEGPGEGLEASQEVPLAALGQGDLVRELVQGDLDTGTVVD